MQATERRLIDELTAMLDARGEVYLMEGKGIGVDICFRDRQNNRTLYIEAKSGSGEVGLPLGSILALAEWRDRVKKQEGAELVIVTENSPSETLRDFLDERGLRYIPINGDYATAVEKIVSIQPQT